MKISKIKNTTVDDIWQGICKEFADSRFTMQLRSKKWGTLDISQVRLTKVKEYCGNHMKACENPNKKHKHTKHLEGADWCEFNDRLNDVLDRLGASALIASSKSIGGCIVRKGDRRRIRYDSNTRVGASIINFAWIVDYDAPDEHFECWCHAQVATPRAWFPAGTPGIHAALGYCTVG